MTHPAVLALLLLLVASVSWLLRDPAQPGETAPATATHSAERQVDYYLRGLQATTMNELGQPARTLRAAEAKYFKDNDTTELLEPWLTVHQGERPAWEVRSESGWVSADGSLVLLQGEVHIERAAAPGIDPMQIETRDLRVQPREDYAETDEQVRVRSNQNWLDATGMQAWLREPSRIKFLADVKGFYAPPSQ